jgi:glycine/D-amino acid oxidase-like deaminating enzyme
MTPSTSPRSWRDPYEVNYHDISLWFDQLAESLTPRPALDGDLDVDVAIVGAGLTGLWTAYYLLEAEPDLRVAVLEKEIAGFGASGRNGGWCSALFPVGASTLAREAGRGAAIAQYAAMRDSVDEVQRVADAEGIAADIAPGGTVVLARNDAQLRRARDEVAEADDYGLGTTLLDGPGASARLAATGVLGATFNPNCAAIQPAKLTRGLADVVEARGARIFERTTVTALSPHLAETARGKVRATHLVRATEGYTAALPGLRRALAPVYSLIIATEPLPQSTWDGIGLRERETFSDHRHLIIYGQRSADGRLVFGGRGAPYHFGSRVRDGFDRDPGTFHELQRVLESLFPALEGVTVTHRWGGPLGVPRDWYSSVGFEPTTGLAWAGGYVGDGVGTSNLAGRTLADLVLRRDTEISRLPWVGHTSPPWEPEPLRWLGINAGLHLTAGLDRTEARTGRRSGWRERALRRLTG